jgi:hypothetical protein
MRACSLLSFAMPALRHAFQVPPLGQPLRYEYREMQTTIIYQAVQVRRIRARIVLHEQVLRENRTVSVEGPQTLGRIESFSGCVVLDSTAARASGCRPIDC